MEAESQLEEIVAEANPNITVTINACTVDGCVCGGVIDHAATPSSPHEPQGSDATNTPPRRSNLAIDIRSNEWRRVAGRERDCELDSCDGEYYVSDSTKVCAKCAHAPKGNGEVRDRREPQYPSKRMKLREYEEKYYPRYHFSNTKIMPGGFYEAHKEYIIDQEDSILDDVMEKDLK